MVSVNERIKRLELLHYRDHAGEQERLVSQIAAETGLSPAEVRAELRAIEEHRRRYGPSTIKQTVQRFAAELGLPEVDV